MYKTTINGQDFEIDFAYLSAGKRLTVWTYEDPAPEDEWSHPQYTKVYEALHPLETEFEAFYSWCGDHFGEDVNAEKLAYEMGMEIRSSDDVQCIKCGNWESWESENMVHGTSMLEPIAIALAAGYWDYACLGCYETVSVDLLQPCPKHEGNYDCTPFCPVCHGNQEISKVVQDA